MFVAPSVGSVTSRRQVGPRGFSVTSLASHGTVDARAHDSASHGVSPVRIDCEVLPHILADARRNTNGPYRDRTPSGHGRHYSLPSSEAASRERRSATPGASSADSA